MECLLHWAVALTEDTVAKERGQGQADRGGAERTAQAADEENATANGKQRGGNGCDKGDTDASPEYVLPPEEPSVYENPEVVGFDEHGGGVGTPSTAGVSGVLGGCTYESMLSCVCATL